MAHRRMWWIDCNGFVRPVLWLEKAGDDNSVVNAMRVMDGGVAIVRTHVPNRELAGRDIPFDAIDYSGLVR